MIGGCAAVAARRRGRPTTGAAGLSDGWPVISVQRIGPTAILDREPAIGPLTHR